MTAISKSLLLVGSVLLMHACYSAHEYSSLPTSLSSTTSAPALSADSPYPSFVSTASSPITSLPLDITIETLVSVVIICLALVLGSEELKPISWRAWAGAIEQGKAKGGEAFRGLEQGKRRGFLDIRSQRKEFADWVRNQDQKPAVKS